MSDIVNSFGMIVFGLVGLVFAGVGATFLFTGLRNLSRGLASRNWPQTTGAITSSSVEIGTTGRSTDNGSSVSPGSNYTAGVRYDYSIGGTTYSSSRVSFASATSTSLHSLQTMVHRYPIGSEVQVWYDRRKPTEAVLEPGVGSGNTAQMILGLALFCFGGVIVMAGVYGPERMFDIVSPEVLAIVLPQLGLVAGMGAIVLGVRNLRRARESARWPSAAGRVVSSTIERTTSSSSSSSRSGTSTSTYMYRALVTFEYEVDGRRYLSDTITFGDYSSSNRGLAERTAARYPIGADVQVFYDPDDPAVGVLERRAAFGTGLFFVVGIVFLLISTVFIMLRSSFR